MKKNKSIIKSGLILSLMTFASRIMGLIREMTKAAFLGTSAYADAFGIAFMIPNLFRRLFAENSISVAFIPTFKGYLEDLSSTKNEDSNEQNSYTEKKQSIQLFVSSTITLASFFTAIITILGIIITPLIIPFFYNGETASSILNETTFLTRIMFPYLFVISVAAFLQGILNGCNIFAPSGFTPVLFNIIVVSVTYLLTPYLPNPQNLPTQAMAARAMSIGVIIGGCFQVIFQIPFVLKTGWKVTFTSIKNAFSNPGTKKVIALIVPTIIGMAAYQLNDLISTAVAGKVGTGTVSSLQYSLRLQELILGIFAVSIGTVILPDLSGLAKRQQWNDFNNMLIQAIKTIALITIPVTFFSFITGKDLISLVYMTKNFDENSVKLTLEVFKFHIAGLFFIAVNRIISPAFYAQGNTKLPTLAGILSFASNIILVLTTAWFFKGPGIAFSLSLSSLINTIFLFIFMKKLPNIEIKKILKEILSFIVKIILFSLIAIIPLYFLHNPLLSLFNNKNRFIAYGAPVFILAIMFAVIGVALLVITKDKTTMAVINKFKSRKTK